MADGDAVTGNAGISTCLSPHAGNARYDLARG
jgi:hypothetical protein